MASIDKNDNTMVILPAFPLGGSRTIPEEDDAEDRLVRSRERNREHARKTRLRKKAQLQGLQSRVKELQAEGQVLRQSVEQCSIASILLGLSSGDQSALSADIADLDSADRKDDKSVSILDAIRGKRKRFLSEDMMEQFPQTMTLHIKGKAAVIGGPGSGKTHINWKSGVYVDQSGVQKQLTPEELEDLRRERNRMHAKMTRDRKKVFISSVEKAIAKLEGENQRLRDLLLKQAKHHLGSNDGSGAVTPSIPSSPVLSAVMAPILAASPPPLLPHQPPAKMPRLEVPSPLTPSPSMEQTLISSQPIAPKDSIPPPTRPAIHGFSVIA
mmetsp:Transcript_63577/g.94349  ORF Transcript_63577/g.94349 Transcript_63577/m.94349 type:complete len:327 (+) Transcript_63577:115-1095(+)